MILPFVAALAMLPERSAQASKYAAIVIEESSGRVLFARNADKAALGKELSEERLRERLGAECKQLSKGLMEVYKHAAAARPLATALVAPSTASADFARSSAGCSR